MSKIRPVCVNDVEWYQRGYQDAKEDLCVAKPPETERWVEWIEPFGPNNEPVHCRVPESTAIAAAKHAASIHLHEYANDAEALTDFMTVHWASFVTPA